MILKRWDHPEADIFMDKAEKNILCESEIKYITKRGK